MNIEDIVALSKAGYTSQQISMMAQAEAMQPKEEPKQEPPKQEPPKQEPTKPKEEPKQEQTTPSYEALMAEVLNLKTAIQQNNINNSQQPAKPAPTADDILAEIIMPKPTNIKEEK